MRCGVSRLPVVNLTWRTAKGRCDIGQQSRMRRLPAYISCCCVIWLEAGLLSVPMNDASQPKCLEASLGDRLLTGTRSC